VRAPGLGLSVATIKPRPGQAPEAWHQKLFTVSAIQVWHYLLLFRIKYRSIIEQGWFSGRQLITSVVIL